MDLEQRRVVLFILDLKLPGIHSRDVSPKGWKYLPTVV
jgi:hypothetical protein